MPVITQTTTTLEIDGRIRPAMRILLAIIALVPLLAPYQLILSPDWKSYMNPYFAFALVVSAGALAVSGLFLWAAIAGLDSRMSFDKKDRVFAYSYRAPVVPFRRHQVPLDSIERCEIEVHDWSDGPPGYSLRVVLKDGRAFSTDSAERPQAEELHRRVAEFLGAEGRTLEPC
jgi:hypothetical protein